MCSFQSNLTLKERDCDCDWLSIKNAIQKSIAIDCDSDFHAIDFAIQKSIAIEIES